MKSKIKKYYIPDPIYHSCLYLVISDHKDFDDHIRRIDGDYESNDDLIPGMKMVYIHYKDKDCCRHTECYLWMPKWEFAALDLSRLSHEVSHFAIKVLLSRGIDIEIDNNESYCYFVEYIFYEILLRLEKIYGKEFKVIKPEYSDD